MQNTSKSQLWVDVGYNLFAKEGMDGLQIERLARILQLNKSGFYHHFGDFDGYLEAISKSHRENASNFTHKLLAIEKLDRSVLMDIATWNMAHNFKPAHNSGVGALQKFLPL